MNLRFDNIQSEILKGYQRTDGDPVPRAAVYLLFWFDPARSQAARELVAALFDRVTSCATWTQELSVNLGFTHLGWKEALGRDDPFDEAFTKGMDQRAESVPLDIGDGSPSGWEFSDGNREQRPGVHALAMIQGRDPDVVDRAAGEVRARAEALGATCREERAYRLKDGRENFGFADGISQPALVGVPGRAEGHGAVTEEGGWRKLAPGELVIGYPDEAGPFAGSSLLVDGSFIALRKLEQDVVGLHRYLHEQAAQIARPTTAEELAAKLVGRWRDGTPLVPLQPGADQNDFRYAADPIGFLCPHGAHARRANPRDVLNRPGDHVERHRLARRGLMYAYQDGQFCLSPDEEAAILQPDFPAGEGEGERRIRRGMIFIAFNADLRRQFEFVQSSWLNLGETSRDRLFTFRDPLTGSNDGQGRFVIPGEPFRVLDGLPRFVTTRGGGYFFLPSLEILRELARGEESRTRSFARSSSRSAPAGFAVGGGEPAGALRFSGWTPAHSPKSKTPAVAPEDRLLLVLAPIRRDERDALLTAIGAGQQPELDALFAAVTDERARPLVHHARFEIVDNFWSWRASGPADQPSSVKLWNDAGYLLFACWFDGARADFARALTRALRTRPFPLDHCYGFPKYRSVGPEWIQVARLRAFFARFGLPAAFCYEGYPAAVDVISKSFHLRGGFLEVIRKVQQDPNDGVRALQAFLKTFSADLDD